MGGVTASAGTVTPVSSSLFGIGFGIGVGFGFGFGIGVGFGFGFGIGIGIGIGIGMLSDPSDFMGTDGLLWVPIGCHRFSAYLFPLSTRFSYRSRSQSSARRMNRNAIAA